MTDEIDYGNVPITKLPPGKALGADDLMNWSHRRATGASGDRKGEVRAAIMRCDKCSIVVNSLIHEPKHWRKHREKCRQCDKPMALVKFKRAGFKR